MGGLPNWFNLSFAQQWSLGPRKDEKDMETTGSSGWSSPPPAHLPPSGAAAWTLQDGPGEGEYVCWLRVLLVETWDVLESGRKWVSVGLSPA